MKAIVVSEHGGPEVLRLQEIPTPEPGAGQARVKIAAAGLNFIDIYQRRGEYSTPLPYTPGYEAAGVVEAVGPDVTTVKPGDRVAYLAQFNAYAEASVVGADLLFRLPDALSFAQGAAFPLQGMTAHYLLHEFRVLKPGETVLIHAAAGGMGLLLVQWAKHLGARVIGTVSTEEKAQAAREAGADDVILYTQQDFAPEVKRLTQDEGAHLIIDGVGKTTFARNFEAAAMRANIIFYGAASGPIGTIEPAWLQPLSLTVSAGHLGNFTRTPEERQRRAQDTLAGIEEGWLKLRIDHDLPLADAAEAHRLLENRATIGKVILHA